MMYSNYFSKPKKNSNILRFTPPGFKYSIDVPFPGRVLPVCARCKKNFKTREHCRTKECHYGLPWTDTYLCITLDPTCTGTDGNLLDGPFIAQGVPNTAYQYSGYIDPKTPSCGPCKEKNYTRTYCRTNKKHRTLPWSTVYVVLTLRPDGVIPPPAEELNPEIVKEMNAKRRKTNSGSKKATSDAGELKKEEQTESGVVKAEEESKKEGAEKGDNKDKDKAATEQEVPPKTQEEVDKDLKEKEAAKLRIVGPSRTFLTTVSVEHCLVEWLEYDATQHATQNRIREEMSIKMQEEATQFPHHYTMMPPPMGMNPMVMNPHFHPHHPVMKEGDNNRGGDGGGGNSSVNSGGQGQGPGPGPGPGPPGLGPGPGQNQGMNGGVNGGGVVVGGGGGGGPPPNMQDANVNNQHPHPGWNMPHPGFPSQQDMMYQSQMGFDPRMAYGFPPPWSRGHPMPMDPGGMMPFDGGPNPMMHQMGWGQGAFYPMPPPHQPQQQHPSPGGGGGNMGMGGVGMPGGGGDMPQSYDGNSNKSISPSRSTNGNSNRKADGGNSGGGGGGGGNNSGMKQPQEGKI